MSTYHNFSRFIHLRQFLNLMALLPFSKIRYILALLFANLRINQVKYHQPFVSNEMVEENFR